MENNDWTAYTKDIFDLICPAQGKELRIISKDERTDFDAAIDATIASVEPLRLRVRGMLMKPFPRAKRAVESARSAEELEEFAGRFRRELEVSSEIASRTFQAGFESILDRLRTTLEERFQDVIVELATGAPKIVLSKRAFLLTPDQLRAVRRDSDVDLTRALSGAAAGSILSGGAAVALAGGILGPIGLLAGALVGWKFGELFGVVVVPGRTDRGGERERVADPVAGPIVLDRVAGPASRVVIGKTRALGQLFDSAAGEVNNRSECTAVHSGSGV
jgi:hypothetical protein